MSPTPSAALLLPCADPVLPDPDTATDNQFAAGYLALGKAYVDCKRRHEDLSTWASGK